MRLSVEDACLGRGLLANYSVLVFAFRSHALRGRSQRLVLVVVWLSSQLALIG